MKTKEQIIKEFKERLRESFSLVHKELSLLPNLHPAEQVLKPISVILGLLGEAIDHALSGANKGERKKRLFSLIVEGIEKRLFLLQQKHLTQLLKVNKQIIVPKGNNRRN